MVESLVLLLLGALVSHEQLDEAVESQLDGNKQGSPLQAAKWADGLAGADPSLDLVKLPGTAQVE